MDQGCSALGSVELLSDRECVCVCVYEREREKERVFLPDSAVFHWLGTEEVSGHIILRSHCPPTRQSRPALPNGSGMTPYWGTSVLLFSDIDVTVTWQWALSSIRASTKGHCSETVIKSSLSLFKSNLSFYSLHRIGYVSSVFKIGGTELEWSWR